MVEAVLFELEGVLVETHGVRRAALERALSEEGYAIAGDAFDDASLGPPVRDAAAAMLARAGIAGDETAVDLVTARAMRHFSGALSGGVSLVDGAYPCVEALAAAARLALVTTAPRAEAEHLLALAGLEFAFECVVTGDDVRAPKPAPDAHRHALGRLTRRRPLAADAALALEGGIAGIRAARAAGLRCIAIGHVPPFHAVEADGYLPSLVGQTLASLSTLAHGEQVR